MDRTPVPPSSGVPEEDGKHWRASEVRLRELAGGTYIRGKIAGFGRLEFGIESYYVQEGKGREYEQAVSRRRLSAEIAVRADGQAVLRSLHVEESGG